MRSWFRGGTLVAVGLLALASIGCGGGSSGASQQQADTVDAYMKALPAWAEFSPVRPDLDPYVAGTPGDTIPTRVNGHDYVCQSTPYAIQRTPDELVMYSPNVEILWPGSLLEGRSYKDGEGVNALLGLTIRERAPIEVSIPALKAADNFRTVVPSLGTVNQAIGAMIGSATDADLRTPSSVNFKMDAFHSEEQFALSIGVSGRYMGFSGAADFSYDQSAEETTIVVHFTEKMFEVVVPPPQTPRAFFSPEFTQAKLDEQIALGKIGEDNLPIYVSNVVYGRMFTFAMTSTETESAIRAALQAAYSFGAGSVSTKISAEQETLIRQSKIKIATVGGDPENVLSVIRSGDWRDYFNRRPKLSAATPLSYTFRTLTGEIALVTETASYAATVCEPGLASGFLPRQTVSIALPTPFTAATGDLNGDGRTDLVWNHRGTTNDAKVGFARMDGTFDMTAPAVTLGGASPTGGWTDFTLLVADMNGDGLDDLVWNRIASGKSETYLALSNGDGTFDPLTVTTRAEAVFANPMTVRTALVESKPGASPPHDLLWSRVTASENVVAATVFGGATPFDLAVQALAAPAGGWGTFAAHGAAVGDLTGDGADDLVFGATGKVCAAVNDGAGVFGVKPVFSGAMACRYECPVEDGFRVADVDGDGKADVLRFDRSYQSVHDCDFWLFGCWSWTNRWNGATQVLLSDGAGGFSATPTLGGWGEWPALTQLHLRDVSGDGKADLVWVTLAAEARVTVATAEVTPTYTTFRPGIDHKPKDALPPGAASWTAFRAYFADVNGDGKTDILLNDHNVVGSIYVDIR